MIAQIISSIKQIVKELSEEEYKHFVEYFEERMKTYKANASFMLDMTTDYNYKMLQYCKILKSILSGTPLTNQHNSSNSLPHIDV